MKLGKGGRDVQAGYPSPCISHPSSEEQPLLCSFQCQQKGTLSRTDLFFECQCVIEIWITICHNSLGFALCYQQLCQSTDYAQEDKICPQKETVAISPENDRDSVGDSV